jgi:hypothetical protein
LNGIHFRGLPTGQRIAQGKSAVVETPCGAEAMKTLSSLCEDLLIDQYAQPAFLPPLWRVIFQEAMRGHHLIFSKGIMESKPEESRLEGTTRKSLEEFCVHLFAAPDLQSIRTMINFLPLDEQKQLFVIYLKLMQSLREENKAALN